MHSTRKPPFAPPPLPGEEDARKNTNVVRLPQGRRNADGGLSQDGAEPPWRQAFVLAEGVKATRTPDKVIRARNGYVEPSVTEPESTAVATGPVASGQPRSAVGTEAVRTPEPV